MDLFAQPGNNNSVIILDKLNTYDSGEPRFVAEISPEGAITFTTKNTIYEGQIFYELEEMQFILSKLKEVRASYEAHLKRLATEIINSPEH